MPYAVPIDQMPGQQRAQGAGAAGDQDGAPAEGAVHRRPGVSASRADEQAVPTASWVRSCRGRQAAAVATGGRPHPQARTGTGWRLAATPRPSRRAGPAPHRRRHARPRPAAREPAWRTQRIQCPYATSACAVAAGRSPRRRGRTRTPRPPPQCPRPRQAGARGKDAGQPRSSGSSTATAGASSPTAGTPVHRSLYSSPTRSDARLRHRSGQRSRAAMGAPEGVARSRPTVSGPVFLMRTVQRRGPGRVQCQALPGEREPGRSGGRLGKQSRRWRPAAPGGGCDAWASGEPARLDRRTTPRLAATGP